jgi:hypothetical protein
MIDGTHTQMHSQLRQKSQAREAKIDTLSNAIHQIEDRTFVQFCSKAGVSNIREFEEKRLHDAKHLTDERLRFSNLKSKLESQYVHTLSLSLSLCLCLCLCLVQPQTVYIESNN